MEMGTDQRLVARSLLAAKGAAWLVAAIGAAVLIGWWRDLELLKSAWPDGATMKPNTALCFVVLAAATWLGVTDHVTSGAQSRRTQVAGRVLALVVLMVTAATLIEDVLRVDLGIDRLLFPDKVSASASAAPGRMSPATAVAFILLAFALAVASGRSPLLRMASHAFALGAALIGLFGFLGYIFGAPDLYQIAPFASMALITAIAIIFLAAGVLALDSERGLLATLTSRGAGGHMARRVLPTAIVLPVVLGSLRLAGQRAGWYGTEIGLAIMVGALVAFLCLVVWLAARSLDRADIRRSEAEAQSAKHLQALRNQEARWRLIVESAPHGIAIIDQAGNIATVNRQLEAAFGYGREELIGRRVELLLPASLRERHIAHRSGYSVKPEARSMGMGRELFGRRKDGSDLPVEVGLSPMRTDDGLFVIATVVDISQRKRAEAALRDSEDRFRQIAESLPQMVWTCEPEGPCDYLSRRWLEYTGVPLENQLGFGWLDQVHPEDREPTIEAWNAAVAGDADFRTEFRIRGHEGNYRWFDTRAVRLRDAQGRTVKWLGSNTDIDDRRHAEEMLRRSQKMEALGTLAGGIAHDFNNILLAITGNTKLGLEELPPEHPVRDCLVEIDKASARAVDLVRRILGFSRQQDSQREPMALAPVVDEALKLLRAALPAMIEIRRNLAPDVPVVSADPTQVHQILMNLATNSACAIGNGGGMIEVALDVVDVSPDLAQASNGLHAGRYARLSVTDNGAGMEKAVLERIFDPFFTTKPVGQGTGLGLSAVHGIMRNHDGAVTVYSEPGKGTTFRLYFPAVEEALPEARLVPRSAERLRSERVMYVDDEAPLVYLTARLLRRAGYSVAGFTDPTQAMVAFRNLPRDFDVVVTDIAMPGMSGFAFVRYIRGIRPDIPVIMTSGYVRPEDQDLARELGVRELIVKPDTVEDLGAALDRVFKES